MPSLMVIVRPSSDDFVKALDAFINSLNCKDPIIHYSTTISNGVVIYSALIVYTHIQTDLKKSGESNV